MAKIASQGALTAVADTAIESTASLRSIRVNFANTGASSRVVTVKFGTRRAKKFTLPADEDRIVGPHNIGSSDTVKAWQDAGTDVEFIVTGDD